MFRRTEIPAQLFVHGLQEAVVALVEREGADRKPCVLADLVRNRLQRRVAVGLGPVPNGRSREGIYLSGDQRGDGFGWSLNITIWPSPTPADLAESNCTCPAMIPRRASSCAANAL